MSHWQHFHSTLLSPALPPPLTASWPGPVVGPAGPVTGRHVRERQLARVARGSFVGPARFLPGLPPPGTRGAAPRQPAVLWGSRSEPAFVEPSSPRQRRRITTNHAEVTWTHHHHHRLVDTPPPPPQCGSPATMLSDLNHWGSVYLGKAHIDTLTCWTMRPNIIPPQLGRTSISMRT